MNAADALTALCAAWGRHDAAAVAALFAEDGRYEGPLFDEVPVGPSAILAACEPAMAELVEIEVPIRAMATTGDLALAEGSFRSLDGDGARLDFDLAMVLEVRDGSVVRFTEYFDASGMTDG
jgi:limonene-1,2-epoxide hydrolase